MFRITSPNVFLLQLCRILIVVDTEEAVHGDEPAPCDVER
jgi:hypothetical protein